MVFICGLVVAIIATTFLYKYCTEKENKKKEIRAIEALLSLVYTLENYQFELIFPLLEAREEYQIKSIKNIIDFVTEEWCDCDALFKNRMINDLEILLSYRLYCIW